MPDHRRAALHASIAAAITLSLVSCSGVGEDEQAFCDAVRRHDLAGARKLLDTGQIDMTAGGGSACSPALAVFDRASSLTPAFIPMAVALAKQPGVATRCFGNRSSYGARSRSRPSGQTCPIDLAAQNGSPEVMRALIENGASVTDVDGRDAIISAVLSGSVPTVEVMIKAGANKNDALISAVAQEKPDVIRYLEGLGAVEEGVEPFLVAARKGDMKTLEAALARRVDVEMEDGGRRTAMMRAAMYGQGAVITRLAKAGANVNARFPIEFDTPLHMAVRGNHPDAVRALAAAGADLNARFNEDTATPVLEAVHKSRVEALAALVDAKANVNVGSAADTTAIGRAIEMGNLALVKQLLRGGARVNDKGGPGWQPPIHETLDNCGLPPEGPGENDNFRMNMLKTLVAAGADPRAANAKGETAFQAITRLRAEAEPYDAYDPQGFRRACFQAKLEYLRTIAAHPQQRN